MLCDTAGQGEPEPEVSGADLDLIPQAEATAIGCEPNTFSERTLRLRVNLGIRLQFEDCCWAVTTVASVVRCSGRVAIECCFSGPS